MRKGTLGLLLLLLQGVSDGLGGQELYLRGQNVQPVFEGWEKNPDGSFTLVFGYLNRNYEEEPYVPVGPNNSFSPGPADRGQPTHFYPRRQSFVFSVRVPADWGTQELVWTVTHHGRTSRAVGSIGDSNWEIDDGVWKANRGFGIFGRMGKEVIPNVRPSIALAGSDAVTASVGGPISVSVAVSDDGQPGRRELFFKLPEKPSAEPIQTPGIPSVSARTGPTTQDMVNASAAFDSGLAVSWILYRGSGGVVFEPRVIPILSSEGSPPSGQATTSATFGRPGTYVIRAYADDGIYTTPISVTVTVTADATGGR